MTGVTHETTNRNKKGICCCYHRRPKTDGCHRDFRDPYPTMATRGLIEKVVNQDDKRVTKYRGTFDTLRYLGISAISELPDFDTFVTEIAKREAVGEKVEENIFKS